MADAEGGVQLSPLLVAQPGAGGAQPPNKLSEGARHLWHEFVALPLAMRLAIIAGIVALGFIGYSRWRATRGSSTPLGFSNADTGGVVGSNAPSPAAPNLDPTQPVQPAAPVPPLPTLVTGGTSTYNPPTQTAAQPTPGATRVQSIAQQIWATSPHSAPSQTSQTSQPAQSQWHWQQAGPHGAPQVQSIAQQIFAQPILVVAAPRGGGGGRLQ